MRGYTFTRLEQIKKPAYQCAKDGRAVGKVFQNWQGWCWVHDEVPMSGVCKEEQQAREALTGLDLLNTAHPEQVCKHPDAAIITDNLGTEYCSQCDQVIS